MIKPSNAPTGRLRVRVDSRSEFLKSNLPYVVRDADHRVVCRGSSDLPNELPEGLYSVAVLTPGGERSVQVAQVRPAETTELLFAAEQILPEPAPPIGPPEIPTAAPGPYDPELSFGDGMTGAARGARQKIQQLWLRRQAQARARAAAAAATPTLAKLTSTTGCEATVEDASGWAFRPDAQLTDVPTATFRIGGRECVMSLPLNPIEPDHGCRVDVVGDENRPALRMSFDPHRRVTGFVDGLLRNNEAVAGHSVIDDASNLMLDKYADPPGAALGGLTLHRFGLLTERRGWVENLARDFSWMPDGCILLAALLQRSDDKTQQARGIELLLSAARRRPMYTDGLSLALELLRRWPDESTKDERYELLGGLANLSAYSDWDSINLSVVN